MKYVTGSDPVAPSGASLDLADDRSQTEMEPAFAQNQAEEVAVDSHIRKANPRGPEDGARRIFRRGYPLIDSTLDGVQRGLVFVCFARTISDRKSPPFGRAFLMRP